MPSYSVKSEEQLDTCAGPLQRLFHEVIRFWDNKILEGKRSLEQQRENVEKGVSKTMHSKHVFPAAEPSLAVDVVPYPLKWPQLDLVKQLKGSDQKALWREIKDLCRFYYFSGYVLGTADQMGIKIRHGGDWDGDRDIHDQNFDDLPHFELVEED